MVQLSSCVIVLLRVSLWVSTTTAFLGARTPSKLMHSTLQMSEQGAWLPICSTSNIPTDLPQSIVLNGERLVVWKKPNSTDWSVMSDVCPHRMAPLSQGRIDPHSGCIECPYHGQQFDTKGTCTLIPQLDVGAQIPLVNNAHTLRTHITGDLLWAFCPLPDGQASSYTTLPEQVLPELLEAPSFTVRELPYSIDFLIENFMDPAHIPFAHHSMQGVRSDGRAIPMQKLTTLENATHCEIGYQDAIRGKPRDGVVSFTAPCYYHFRVKETTPSGTEQFRKQLIAVLGGSPYAAPSTTPTPTNPPPLSPCPPLPLHPFLPPPTLCHLAPISPGKSRIFLELPVMRKMRTKFPTWLLHTFSNRFLDSDVWIHDQERTQRIMQSSAGGGSGAGSGGVGSKYVMPTQSDTGTREFRAWWRKHMMGSPVFGEPKEPLTWLSHEEQLDRYESHAKHCKSCSGALKNAQLAKKLTPFVSLFLLALVPSRVLRVLTVVLGFAVDQVCDKIIRGIMGPKRGDIYSAAQFPAK